MELEGHLGTSYKRNYGNYCGSSRRDQSNDVKPPKCDPYLSLPRPPLSLCKIKKVKVFIKGQRSISKFNLN